MKNNEKITRWLDKQVKWYFKDSVCIINTEITLENISRYTQPEIQLSERAFNYIVDTLGIERIVTPWKAVGSNNKYELSFNYKDVRFFTLTEEEIEDECEL